MPESRESGGESVGWACEEASAVEVTLGGGIVVCGSACEEASAVDESIVGGIVVCGSALSGGDVC